MLLEYWSISPPICLHCAVIVSQIFSNDDMSALYVRLLQDIHCFFKEELCHWCFMQDSLTLQREKKVIKILLAFKFHYKMF